MNNLARIILFAFLALPAGAQDSTTRVTVDQLQNRIQAAQDAADLDDTTRARLVDLYRQAINNLEAIRVNKEMAEEFRQAARKAPRETDKIVARIERRREAPIEADLDLSPNASTDALVRKLNEELANQTAVQAKLAVLGARLESETKRPTEARARINAARGEVARLAAQAGEPPGADRSPQFAEALRWARATRLEALQVEITMLDRELLSYTERNALLGAQRDEQALGLQRINQRAEALREFINERRRTEAERAIAQATAVLDSATTDEPLLKEFADANLKRVDLLQAQVDELERLAKRETTRPTNAQIQAAFRSARRKLELDAAGVPVGLAILEERANFPTARELNSERRKVSSLITQVSLRLIQSEEILEDRANLDEYLDNRLAESGAPELDATARQELEELATTQQLLIERTIANDVSLQRRLYELDDALKRVSEELAAYDDYLAERLLWVRSTRLADAEEWAKLPAQLVRYLNPASWADTLRILLVRAIEAPVFPALALVAIGIGLRRGRIHRALVDCGQSVGRIRDDSMALTFRAVACTALLAAPVPLLLGAIGGALNTAPAATDFSVAIGHGLVRIALWLLFVLLLLNVFRAEGLGGRHFGWDLDALRGLRRQFSLFVVVALPALFVSWTANQTDQLTGALGGVLSTLVYCVVMIAFIVLVVRAFHPTRGAIRQVLAARPESRWWRWRFFWFPVALVFPVAFIFLAYIGFDYTAVVISQSLFQSVALVTAIWLVAALVRRWLLMTNRRLAYNKALAALEASRARRAGEGEAEGAENHDEGDIGEPEIDLVALNTDSQQLLNATALLLVFLGLFAVWGDVIPAFGVLERVSLWNKTALIDGVEQLVPVTLEDLLLAVVVSFGGYVLATNLPSLINIILLKQGSVSAGGRYTVKTLTSYTITALVILVVLNLLGVRAAQLGWAAAALGVGIGFGLQEIVANFICGLILLFERPIRVGDVITVGDATGTVNKIRIRATTIRDWEQKELVLPNKELITGRLLNWTLTDATTRITITVGVAYGSDTERAMELMREAAMECPTVLEEPAPYANFEQFGDSTLNLTLRIFIGSTSDRLSSQTDVLRRIDRKFKAAGIVIAFPQRDVHVIHETPPTPVSGAGRGDSA